MKSSCKCNLTSQPGLSHHPRLFTKQNCKFLLSQQVVYKAKTGSLCCYFKAKGIPVMQLNKKQRKDRTMINRNGFRELDFFGGGGGGGGEDDKELFRAAKYSKVAKAIFQKNMGGHATPQALGS